MALVGCAPVGPDYSTPNIELQDRYYQGPAVANRSAAFERWWEHYKDPTLSRLIWHALADNLDVAAAFERLREAEFGLQRYGPDSQASGNAEVSAQRRNANGSTNDVENASINASFLFDVFGAVRRAQEQAVAVVEARRFEVGTVRLALFSSLTESYIRARYFQEAAEITRSSMSSRRRLLNVVQRRRTAEESTLLEVEQARALLQATQATLPPLISGFEANVFRISTLLASPAEPVMAMLARGSRQPLPRWNASAGVPADLLRNRPDVRRAERELAAATAAIGIAEADLYPSLRLDGSVVLGDSEGWSFGPRLTFPVLGRKVLRANRDAALSRARQAEIEWRSTVFEAVESVQAAQSQCRHLARQVAALRGAVQSSKRVLDLSKVSYDGGAIVLSDVLDAEVDLSNARLSLAGAVRDLAISWASLQIAAGKGWGDMKEVNVAAVEG